MLEGELFHPKELAKLLGISQSTLKQWRLRSRGPAYVRVGGSVRYPVKDVHEWLENHKFYTETAGRKDVKRGLHAAIEQLRRERK